MAYGSSISFYVDDIPMRISERYQPLDFSIYFSEYEMPPDFQISAIPPAELNFHSEREALETWTYHEQLRREREAADEEARLQAELEQWSTFEQQELSVPSTHKSAPEDILSSPEEQSKDEVIAVEETKAETDLESSSEARDEVQPCDTQRPESEPQPESIEVIMEPSSVPEPHSDTTTTAYNNNQNNTDTTLSSPETDQTSRSSSTPASSPPYPMAGIAASSSTSTMPQSISMTELNNVVPATQHGTNAFVSTHSGAQTPYPPPLYPPPYTFPQAQYQQQQQPQQQPSNAMMNQSQPTSIPTIPTVYQTYPSPYTQVGSAPGRSHAFPPSFGATAPLPPPAYTQVMGQPSYPQYSQQQHFQHQAPNQYSSNQAPPPRDNILRPYPTAPGANTNPSLKPTKSDPDLKTSLALHPAIKSVNPREFEDHFASSNPFEQMELESIDDKKELQSIFGSSTATHPTNSQSLATGTNNYNNTTPYTNYSMYNNNRNPVIPNGGPSPVQQQAASYNGPPPQTSVGSWVAPPQHPTGQPNGLTPGPPQYYQPYTNPLATANGGYVNGHYTTPTHQSAHSAPPYPTSTTPTPTHQPPPPVPSSANNPYQPPTAVYPSKYANSYQKPV